MVKVYVGVTDEDWYNYLAGRPDLDEVNFWRPGGGRGFHVLDIGEPFHFKAHHPHNHIVGGGFYSGNTALPLSEAWDLYGQANGAATLDQMRTRIARYRRHPLLPGEDPIIGCLFIRDPVFLTRTAAADPPPQFAPSIVQGKSYDTANQTVAPYFTRLADLVFGGLGLEVTDLPWHRPGPVYGQGRLVAQRLGQRAFQAVVLDAYHRRCAITGATIRPVLQAAHIRPLPAGGEHRLDNGLLLRSDTHTLYDQGYLGIDTHHRLLVSPRLRTEFGNGQEYYTRAGEQITVPDRKADRPHREFLEWHLDTVYKAA